MGHSEKDTRLKLIDPKLKNAGWVVLNKKHEIQRGMACIETPVNGMKTGNKNSTGTGFVDYVLFGDDGKPLALVEAKKCIVNEEQGKVQACLYADCLEKRYGVRPIIYYTNGYTIKIIDGLFPPREVFGFHKKEELEYLIQKRKFQLVNVETNICDRYYQQDAIKEVIKHFKSKHSRSLIVLATGTGKTRVSCGISEIFLKNNYVKRILFLADRVNLVKQAKEGTFEKFLPNVPMSVLTEGKKENEDNKARIVFSTYQTMLSIIKDTTMSPYGIGHFDLIIVDEAHRSLFNKYKEIFDYFDALMIGLTATPRNDISKSTYKVFNLDMDAPNYEYDLVKGVKDGYLTYYRALDRTPEILKKGVIYDDLSPKEQEEYEELFSDDDGNIPSKIEGKKFYSVITNKDTIRKVLKQLMEEGLKVNNGDELGKTIIFARDHNHAILIQDEFRKLYPEKCIANQANGVDYCVVIDNKIKFNEILQREFKEKQSIRIVISVDMMDTGVDIPDVVNLVFFKKVLSKIKFWQMIGRGTRLCENLKIISPSSAYFQRSINDPSRSFYKDKQGFLIFDICNVFPFFKQNPDGEINSTSAVLSLYQKVFLEKATLYKAMINNYQSLDKEDKHYLNNLKSELLDEVNKMNENYIGVQSALKYVHKYSEESGWLSFGQNELVEIKNYIAPNIIGQIDIEQARVFDCLCFKLASSKIARQVDFEVIYKHVYVLIQYLIDKKSHIEEVSNKLHVLKFAVSDKFLNEANASVIDKIREELRELIRFIESSEFDPIITDFTDAIISKGDADEAEINFDSISIEDFKPLDKKVISFIESHSNEPLIVEIKHLVKPKKKSILHFKNEVIDLSRSADEYNDIFPNEEDLVKIVRRTVSCDSKSRKALLNSLRNKGFNEEQVDYANDLISFVFQNGIFIREDLISDRLPNFDRLFNEAEIEKLVTILESIF